MNGAGVGADLVGALVGFILTVFVFSYIFGDNILFRIAIYTFIGVAAGFAAVIVVYNILLHQLVFPILTNPAGSLALIPPLLLGLWLLVTKVSPRFSRLGNPVMAFLVGAAAAIAIGGVVLGTLFPQMAATNRLLDLSASGGLGSGAVRFLQGIIVLVGTVTTLAYFHFGTQSRLDGPAQRPGWVNSFAQVGQVFIIATFGVLFAGVYAASLTALIERLDSILNLFRPFISN